MANGQNDFYTLESLTTFAASAGATTVVSNGIQRALNVNPRWLALAVAEAISIGTVYFTHASASGQPVTSDYFLAVLNGFLVYSTAAGSKAIGNTLVNGPRETSGVGAERGGTARGETAAQHAPASSTKRGFLSPWY